jgi:hypothetical protein
MRRGWPQLPRRPSNLGQGWIRRATRSSLTRQLLRRRSGDCARCTGVRRTPRDSTATPFSRLSDALVNSFGARIKKVMTNA